MLNIANKNLNYDRPIMVDEGIYWIGFYDKQSGLHCNPYLIIEGDEAVVIDGGSRPDFPTVLMKILQTGVNPSSIKALIYQHYDPDLCGSVPNFEKIIKRSDLMIISDRTNNAFIRHYYVTSPLTALDEISHRFVFSTGRELKFIPTPYAHAAGSFVTFDAKSGVVFTSDIFGSYAVEWDLFLTFGSNCYDCTQYSACPGNKKYCPIPDILNFHRLLMPSERILRLTIETISRLPLKLIVPQHGSIIYEPNDIIHICKLLVDLKGVGIDGISDDRPFCQLGDLSCLMETFKKQ